MSTYIKMYRALAEHELLSNDNTAYLVFTKVLLKANWKTGVYRTGRKKLGLLTNLKDTTAWGGLKRLENDGMVTLTSTGRFTDIYISNWWKYQGKTEKTDDSSGSDTEHSTDTKQEQKNKEIIYTGEELELLNLVNKITGRKFETLPPVHKSTLSQFSLSQIESSLKNLIMDDWHQPKMKVVGLDYLLRPHTLKRFLASAKEAPKPKSIGGTANKKNTDDRSNLSRKQLQELEQGL
jgi:hypothetical protein